MAALQPAAGEQGAVVCGRAGRGHPAAARKAAPPLAAAVGGADADSPPGPGAAPQSVSASGMLSQLLHT
jgi:hypothetical protein